MAGDRAVGVLSLRFREAGPLAASQRDLLDAFVRQIALVLEQGDLAGAAEFLGKAVSLQPGLDRARFELAMTLYRSGNYGGARSEAELLLPKPGYTVSSGLLLGGVIGRLFREFAVTIAAAVLVSGFVSLTLTPMISSRILRPVRVSTSLMISDESWSAVT